MLYKVGGTEAVKIKFGQEERIQIGTDEPLLLLKAIWSVTTSVTDASDELAECLRIKVQSSVIIDEQNYFNWGLRSFGKGHHSGSCLQIIA